MRSRIIFFLATFARSETHVAYLLSVTALEYMRFAHARALGSIDSPRARLSAINLGVLCIRSCRETSISCWFRPLPFILVRGGLKRSSQVDGSIPVNLIVSYRGIFSLRYRRSKELPRWLSSRKRSPRRRRPTKWSSHCLLRKMRRLVSCISFTLVGLGYLLND